jgi:hypothetical protein
LPGEAKASAEVQGLLVSPADVRSLFQQLLPGEHFAQLRRCDKLRENNRVYNASVVMWLMIAQRLQGGNLATSVLELICGLPPSFWSRPCKRLLPGPNGRPPRLSANTASYNEARHDLPLEVVEACFDQVFNELIAKTPGSGCGMGGRAFFVDGTSARTPHNPELCNAYPPATNQSGESHWPTLRLLVAHDLNTGLAMRPHWGPMYGPQAVSEQGLLEEVLHQLRSIFGGLCSRSTRLPDLAAIAAVAGHAAVGRAHTGWNGPADSVAAFAVRSTQSSAATSGFLCGRARDRPKSAPQQW